MPTNLTDVDTWTSPIVVPAGGDPRTAASVQTAFQGLANRTHRINDRLGDLLPGFNDDTAAGLPVLFDLQSPCRNSSDRFAINADFMWEQASVTDAGQCSFRVQVPIIGVIKSFAAVLQGPAGNAVAPLSIGTPPKVQLHRIPIATTSGADEQIGLLDYNLVGAPASSAAYKAAHVLTTSTFSGSSPTVLNGQYTYMVQFFGETGSNSAVGWMVRACYLLVARS